MAEQQHEPVDAEYPGTAVRRMRAAMERARGLTVDELSDTWPEVRRRVLWAAGLRDIEIDFFSRWDFTYAEENRLCYSSSRTNALGSQYCMSRLASFW